MVGDGRMGDKLAGARIVKSLSAANKQVCEWSSLWWEAAPLTRSEDVVVEEDEPQREEVVDAELLRQVAGDEGRVGELEALGRTRAVGRQRLGAEATGGRRLLVDGQSGRQGQRAQPEATTKALSLTHIGDWLLSGRVDEDAQVQTGAEQVPTGE
jgi:hypothetical protein